MLDVKKNNTISCSLAKISYPKQQKVNFKWPAKNSLLKYNCSKQFQGDVRQEGKGGEKKSKKEKKKPVMVVKILENSGDKVKLYFLPSWQGKGFDMEGSASMLYARLHDSMRHYNQSYSSSQNYSLSIPFKSTFDYPAHIHGSFQGRTSKNESDNGKVFVSVTEAQTVKTKRFGNQPLVNIYKSIVKDDALKVSSYDYAPGLEAPLRIGVYQNIYGKGSKNFDCRLVEIRKPQ